MSLPDRQYPQDIYILYVLFDNNYTEILHVYRQYPQDIPSICYLIITTQKYYMYADNTHKIYPLYAI